MKHRASPILGGLVLAAGISVPAQSHEPGGGHQHTHGEDNVEFLERSPRIGDPIPDVSGFDEQGDPVSLADFRGQYTVLICGCLT